MKTNCDIIQDLLPLYCDNVCSEESKQTIEEHIQECEQCRNDLLQMQKEIKGETPHINEQKVTKVAKTALKKKKTIAFVAGCLVVLLLVSLVIGAGFTYHALNSADGDDYDSLRAHAERYLGWQIQYIKQIEIKGDYLAALCKNEYGDWDLCVFKRDGLLKNRWVTHGKERGLNTGDRLGAYFYGNSEGVNVVVIFGGDVPSEVKSYRYETSDVTYICPANKYVLDIFIIYNQKVGGGFIDVLDENGEEIDYLS